MGAPSSDRWEKAGDRAMLLLAAQTGLRVSELIGLDCGDVSLGAGACVSQLFRKGAQATGSPRSA